MVKKITRIFECKNGHRYKSKKPIICSVHQIMNFMFLGKDAIDLHCNDYCRICGAVIVKEDNYVDGKVVMGAVRMI